MGIEPTSRAWEAGVIAIIRHPQWHQLIKKAPHIQSLNPQIGVCSEPPSSKTFGAIATKNVK